VGISPLRPLGKLDRPVVELKLAWLTGPAALSISIDSVLVQDAEPSAAELDDCVVVLSVRAGSYFGFNRVASDIWTMLAEPCRVGQIFASLAERHDVDAQTLARDVAPFLQSLIEHRLVRLIDPGKTP
jgi:Coenzyme PQQ synthesis protein D (PqqD)